MYGARPIVYEKFLGLCDEARAYAQDPGEVPMGIAIQARDVDFEVTQLRKRLGYTPYNTTAPASSKVYGLFAYYPSSGARKILAAVGTGFYDVPTSGASTSLATFSSADWVDFMQWRDDVFAGHAAAGVYKWSGSGSAAAVALLTAPTSVTLTALTTPLETFDSGSWTEDTSEAAWSNTTTIGSMDASHPPPREGASMLEVKITGAAAEDDFIYKAWPGGGTADLSGLDHIELFVWCDRRGPAFQVAVYNNTDTLGTNDPGWGDWKTHRIKRRKQWQKVVVPLQPIAPANRSASKGLAIHYLGDGGVGYTRNLFLYFDYCAGVCRMVPDTYEYCATFAVMETSGGTSFVKDESAPTAAVSIDVPAPGLEAPPFRGVNVTVNGTAPAAATHVFIYRRRKTGPDPFFRRVASFSAVSPSYPYVDDMDDGELAVEAAKGNAPRMPVENIAPPACATYALVNNRMLGGNRVAAPAVPSRVYISRFESPHKFSEQQDVFDELSAGWVDIPNGDIVRRIVAFREMALIFCAGSVWSLEGSGFHDFVLRKRLPIGLDGRNAVAVSGDVVYFLARDGVRAMIPTEGTEGSFLCWIISEPMETRTREIADRSIVAFGVDERGRVLINYDFSGGQAMVFNPEIPGAMGRQRNVYRPGWTVYGNSKWNFSVFHTLQTRGGDSGQLLAGHHSGGRIYYLFRDSANAATYKDNVTGVITDPTNDPLWIWQGSLLFPPDRRSRVTVVYMSGRWYTGGAAGAVKATIYDETGTAVDGPRQFAIAPSGSSMSPFTQRFSPAAAGNAVSLYLAGVAGTVPDLRGQHLELGVMAR